MCETRRDKQIASQVQSSFINLLKLFQKALLQKDSRSERYWLKFYDRKTFLAAVARLGEHGYQVNKDFVPTAESGYHYIELKSQFWIESLENQIQFNSFDEAPLLNLSKILQLGLLQKDSITKQCWLKFYDQKTFITAIAGFHEQGYLANEDFVPTIESEHRYIELRTPFLIESANNPNNQIQFNSLRKFLPYNVAKISYASLSMFGDDSAEVDKSADKLNDNYASRYIYF